MLTSIGLEPLIFFLVHAHRLQYRIRNYSRCSDDDFGIDQFLVELGVLTLFVRCSNQSMSLVFQPFPNTKLVLGGPKKFRNLFGMLAALVS